jgi:raffinose/stachyose/melibiose transport system substrate-binding protein
MVLSIFVAGCSSKGSKGSSKKEVVLDIFNIKVETKKQLEELAKRYEDENPGVKINVTTVGGGQDASSALQAKFSSGEEPAIFLLGGLSDTQKYLDKLLDVADMESAKTASKGTLEGATIDGVPYGIPLNIEGFGLMINKEIFNKAGINPDDIKSFEDFTNAVKTLDSKKDELGLEAVFGFSGKEDWVVNQFSNHFLAPEFNNSLIEAFNSKQLSYKYGDRMKEYVDLINKYNVQPILSLDYSTSVEELFVNGKVAIIHQGNWIVPTLDSIDPEFSQKKLGMLPLFVESDTEGRISAGPSWYWGINKTKDKAVVEESKKFLDWMYTSEEGKKAIVEEFKYIPAHEGYELDKITDPVSKVIYQQMQEGKTYVWAHNQYPNGWFQTSLFPEFQKYLSGDISWDEFKANTNKAYSQMR